MKVYLVEVVMGTTKKKRLEPIALKEKWYEADALIGDRVGLITEMDTDGEYPEGIGDCNHWHYEKDMRENQFHEIHKI